MTNQMLNNQSNESTNLNNTNLSGMEPIVELYTFPFIVVMATVCNILTFLVMRQKNMRKHSTCFYMAVLAIADELVILVGCLNYWVYLFFNKSIMFTQFGCKILCSALYGTLHFSVWIVVIMTIERYIAVALPLQANIYCTVNRAKVACFILALIISSINFHFLITHSLVNGECIPSTKTYEKFMENFWPWIDGVIYSYIPLTLLIIFNILIVHSLIKASENIKKLQNQTNSTNNSVKYFKTHRYWCLILPFFCLLKTTKQDIRKENDPLYSSNANNNSNKYSKRDSVIVITNTVKQPVGIRQTVSNHSNISGKTYNQNVNTQHPPSNSSSNRRLTIMLLVVSITFCLTSVPIVTLQTIERYLKEELISSNNYNNIVILKGVFLALQYLNHSVNFFLYAVTGKTFRREFFALFGIRCSKEKHFSKNVNLRYKSKLVDHSNIYKRNNRNLKSFMNNTTITEYSSYDNIYNNCKQPNYDYKYDSKSNKLIKLGEKKRKNELKCMLSENDLGKKNELNSKLSSSSVASIFRDNSINNKNNNLD